MPSKEARYADALAEDLYTKSKTDLPEGTDYAIVKGPTGTRIPIPRNGEDDESWHERIKNWQDRGVLVDWKGPAAEKMRTPEAKVVAVEDAQPDGELAFRQANKKLIDERQASEIADARGAGIKSQAEALKQKGIPYIFNDEGLFIPRGQNMTDEQWQAAKDAAAKKFTSISVWDGPDKEPDSDADERVASGSGGSKFDQLRKAMSSLFTNAMPEGSPAFQQGYTEGSSVGQSGAPVFDHLTSPSKYNETPPTRVDLSALEDVDYAERRGYLDTTYAAMQANPEDKNMIENREFMQPLLDEYGSNWEEWMRLVDNRKRYPQTRAYNSTVLYEDAAIEEATAEAQQIVASGGGVSEDEFIEMVRAIQLQMRDAGGKDKEKK